MAGEAGTIVHGGNNGFTTAVPVVEEAGLVGTDDVDDVDDDEEGDSGSVQSVDADTGDDGAWGYASDLDCDRACAATAAADLGLVALLWCGFLTMAFDLAVTAAVQEGCCRRGLVTRRRGVDVVIGTGYAGATGTAVVVGF